MRARKRVVTGRTSGGRTPAPRRSPTVRPIRSAIVPAAKTTGPAEGGARPSTPTSGLAGAAQPGGTADTLGPGVDLSVALVGRSGLRLRNPILVAAGCAGYGPDVADGLGLANLGAVVTRTTTLRLRDGSPAPRLVEMPGSVLWATGFPNPGIEAVIERYGPAWADLPTALVVSVGGEATGEVVEVVRRLEDVPGVAAIELNLAEVRSANADSALVATAVGAVRRETERPLLVKLPYADEPRRLGRAAVEAGADALSGPGGIRGRVVLPASGLGLGGRSAPWSVRGFLAGPAVRPLALDFVAELAAAVRVPIVALVGVHSLADVLDYLAAGATAVGVGSAALADPSLPGRLVAALGRACAAAGVGSLEALAARLRDARSARPETTGRTLSP